VCCKVMCVLNIGWTPQPAGCGIVVSLKCMVDKDVERGFENGLENDS
jgi:hypothetical protein